MTTVVRVILNPGVAMGLIGAGVVLIALALTVEWP